MNCLPRLNGPIIPNCRELSRENFPLTDIKIGACFTGVSLWHPFAVDEKLPSNDLDLFSGKADHALHNDVSAKAPHDYISPPRFSKIIGGFVDDEQVAGP